MTEKELAKLPDEAKVIPLVGREIASAFQEMGAVCSLADLGDDQAEIEQIVTLIDKYT